MRVFLNAILSFIGAESLTDLEFETVEAESQAYDQATYDDLARILDARDGISVFQGRLIGYYTAKGVAVTEIDTARSNILLGIPL